MIEFSSILFFWLVLVHLIYDFHIQGDFVGVMKGKYDFILFIHCLTYAMCLSAVLMYFNTFSIINFLYLLITHIIIDRWKAREEIHKLTLYLWIDQALHLLVIITLSFVRC